MKNNQKQMEQFDKVLSVFLNAFPEKAIENPPFGSSLLKRRRDRKFGRIRFASIYSFILSPFFVIYLRILYKKIVS